MNTFDFRLHTSEVTKSQKKEMRRELVKNFYLKPNL